jgi:HAE1 family hydrophobic/amphiphilic exporter-1
MKLSLPTLAVRRPITAAMLLVSVLLFGGIAAMRLPLAFLPEVDVPFIGVRIPYPDSNPAQVEREIAKPVEEVLSTLSGIKKLRSTSDADGAWVQLQFDWGQDLDVVRMQVSELMDQVKADLPEDIGEIAIWSFNTNDIPVVEARISAEGVDLSENYDLLEARVVNRLRRLPGVARVDLDGVEPKEIFIDLVLDKVKAHGVDVGLLIQRLRAAASNLVLGRIHDGQRRLTARALGSFDSIDAIRNLVIDERGLRLSEVAEVSYEEPPISYGRRLNGKDAVALLVFKESTANTVDVVRSVMSVIEGDIDRDPLLQGVDVFVWQDQGDQIVSALHGLTRAGMIGALLAVAVLYFFLRRLGSTLIVSLSIPFSIIAACGVMWFLGKNLNVLSMMGLMLGVGMLVDNAIVVLESIDRRSRVEKDPKKAALWGAEHVGMAVVASTATSLIVFLPLIVGSRSELTTWLGEVGIAISLALVCSLFSSLTLIPLVAAWFLRPGRSRRVASMERLEDRYAALLAWTLRHKVATFGLLTVGFVAGIVPFLLGWVETGTFTARVNERMYLSYEFSDFVYKSRASDTVARVEDYLFANREDFGIESVYSYFASNEAGTTLTFDRKDLGDREFKELRQRIRDGLPEIPGVRLLFREDTDSGGGSTYFAVHFFGQDTGVLARLAAEAERRLATVEGVEDVTSDLRRGRREIHVRIDRDKAARLGVSAQDVSNIFSFTLGGLRLPRFNTGEREVDSWLALRLEDRSNLADLAKLQFRAVDGRPVLLGDIATFEVIEKPQEIERENRKVRVAVRATYEGEHWDQARQRIAALMDAFELPGGYSWSWNDRILEQDTQGQQMGVNFLLALALVYLVMASLFESLAQPFAILFSIPFAMPGAAWLMAITRTPFNLMGQIGLLILMGIVVNNGIVLLDHMNQLRRAGLGREESIVQAGRDRMRAILMTASTTIIGLVPLAAGGSRVGGLFYYPLAITVIGGLMSSSVLTLVVLPYVSLGAEGVARWLRTLWSRSAPGARRQSPREEETVIAPSVAGG